MGSVVVKEIESTGARYHERISMSTPSYYQVAIPDVKTLKDRRALVVQVFVRLGELEGVYFAKKESFPSATRKIHSQTEYSICSDPTCDRVVPKALNFTGGICRSCMTTQGVELRKKDVSFKDCVTKKYVVRESMTMKEFRNKTLEMKSRVRWMTRNLAFSEKKVMKPFLRGGDDGPVIGDNDEGEEKKANEGDAKEDVGADMMAEDDTKDATALRNLGSQSGFVYAMRLYVKGSGAGVNEDSLFDTFPLSSSSVVIEDNCFVEFTVKAKVSSHISIRAYWEALPDTKKLNQPINAQSEESFVQETINAEIKMEEEAKRKAEAEAAKKTKKVVDTSASTPAPTPADVPPKEADEPKGSNKDVEGDKKVDEAEVKDKDAADDKV